MNTAPKLWRSTNSGFNNSMSTKAIIWAIAGSDNSGGAGIQADNQAARSFAVHSCNIVTAITSQNDVGVHGIVNTPVEFLENQWQSLKPYPPQAIKLGMLACEQTIDWLCEKLKTNTVAVVCDPVLAASSGGNLMQGAKFYKKLLPLVDVIAPNQKEFEALFADEINSQQSLGEQALAVAKKYQCSVIVTGGDVDSEWARDVIAHEGEVYYLQSPMLKTQNVHGTGCSFATAIAANIAKGERLLDAVVLAKAYLYQGLKNTQNVGQSSIGPFIHNHGPATSINDLPVLNKASTPFAEKAPATEQHLGLYPVVATIEQLKSCLENGIKTIQLRAKDKTQEEAEPLVKQAVALGQKHNARLFINDYWQLAIKYKAYGIHLGQEDLDNADVTAIYKAGCCLGISTHAWYEIARAHYFKPSYIAIGPIFATTTKDMPFDPQGLKQLQMWQDFIGEHYPTVAIGGINKTNAADVLATGVGSIAMVRPITEAQDQAAAINELNTIIKNYGSTPNHE